MRADEYAGWRQASLRSYAADVSRANGIAGDVALSNATKQFDELLPDGLATPGVWLTKVVDDSGETVGDLWLGPHATRPDVAFVYEIAIVDSRRGQGLGRAAMTAAEGVVRAAGYGQLGLSVFGHNPAAQGLYASLGYDVVATQMLKRL